MSAYEQPLVIHDRRAELRDFTAEIAAADSPEDQRKLLAEKQAALHAGRPSPELCKPAKQALADQIKDNAATGVVRAVQGEGGKAGGSPGSRRFSPASSP